MNADVDVRQISSDSHRPQTFFNIEHEEGYIGIWGNNYNLKTVLGICDNNFFFYQFESDMDYFEWESKNTIYFDRLIDIKDLK
jgi:hypothetical protein